MGENESRLIGTSPPSQEGAGGEEPSRPAELSRLTQALEEKEAEIIALVDRLKRTAAEFDNYKKRTAKDKEEFRKFALEGLILEILPVIDNLERAISHGEGPAPASGLLEGVRITLSQLVKSLEKFGVTSFDSRGAAFDPERHEAMEVVESSLFTPDTIIEEHRKGYLLNGRVIRPALVTVAKAPIQGAESEKGRLLMDKIIPISDRELQNAEGWIREALLKIDPGVQVGDVDWDDGREILTFGLKKAQTKRTIGMSREYIQDHEQPDDRFEPFLGNEVDALSAAAQQGERGCRLGRAIGNTRIFDL